MTKNIIESWITTSLGTLIGIFGGVAFWFDKLNVWETIPVWIIAAILIAADEKSIKGLVDKIPKLK